MQIERAQFDAQFDQAARHLCSAIEYGLPLLKSWMAGLLEQAAQQQAATFPTRPTQEPMMKLQEAADYLQIKKRTLQSWIQDGKIEPRYAEGEPRFKRCELDEWTAKNKPHRNK